MPSSAVCLKRILSKRFQNFSRKKNESICFCEFQRQKKTLDDNCCLKDLNVTVIGFLVKEKEAHFVLGQMQANIRTKVSDRDGNGQQDLDALPIQAGKFQESKRTRL